MSNRLPVPAAGEATLSAQHNDPPADFVRKLGYCLLPVLLGAGAALVLLRAAGGPARPAYAGTLTFPGACGATIQQCIDGASTGDTILISAGDYTESLTLSKTVSLIGELSSTTILHALPNTRVLTVTGAAVDSSVVISGLTFTGGVVTTTFSCPDGCGGAILLNNGAQPRLEEVIIRNNTAIAGGGLYSEGDLSLNAVALLTNTAQASAGGLFASGMVTLTGSLVQSNTAGYQGGGIYAGSGARLTNDRLLFNNSGDAGAGLRAAGSVTLTNVLVEHNTCAPTSGCIGGLSVAGSATISGGDFLGNDGGLSVAGSLALTGTQFLNNTWGPGGAGVDGAATVSGALFQSNRCFIVGGYICIGGGLTASGPVTVNNTRFVSNTGQASAGGLFSASAVTVTGGVFQGNSPAGLDTFSSLIVTGTQFLSNSGLGAVADNPATVTGALFQENTGGGLYARYTVNIINSVFLSNTGTGATASGNTTVAGSLFQNNQCLLSGCFGGGLLVDGTLTATNSQFLSNTAQAGGGGIYLNFTGSGARTLAGDLFQGNRCVESGCEGGGLFANGSPMLAATQFISNSAVAGGGGALISGATLAGGRFQGNQCTATDCLGGGLYASYVALTGTVFLNNRSAGQGGGLALPYGDGRVVNALFARNSAGDGAALSLGYPGSFQPGSVAILYTTITSPTRGGGSAIVINSATLSMADSIVAGYTTGISLTAGSAGESHNLFFGNTHNLLGAVVEAGGSVTAAPLFVNPAGDDDHLLPDSPARHLGVDAGVYSDVDGNPRPLTGGFDAGYDQSLAPWAAPDLYRTLPNAAVVVAAPGVLANDAAAYPGPLTAHLLSGPFTGSLNLAPTGAFTYTPSLGFTGIVTFTYQASDGVLFSGPALVTVDARRTIFLPLVQR